MKTKTNNFTMTYGVMQWIVIASIFAAHASSPCTSLSVHRKVKILQFEGGKLSAFGAMMVAYMCNF